MNKNIKKMKILHEYTLDQFSLNFTKHVKDHPDQADIKGHLIEGVIPWGGERPAKEAPNTRSKGTMRDCPIRTELNNYNIQLEFKYKFKNTLI
jgi:hypothetical protein